MQNSYCYACMVTRQSLGGLLRFQVDVVREIEERRVDKKVVGINMLVLIHFHLSFSLSTYKLDPPISLRERERENHVILKFHV